MKKTGILVLMMAVLTATLSGCGSSGSAAASKADTESQKSSAGEEGASGEAAIEATDLTWGTGTLGGPSSLWGRHVLLSCRKRYLICLLRYRLPGVR